MLAALVLSMMAGCVGYSEAKIYFEGDTVPGQNITIGAEPLPPAALTRPSPNPPHSPPHSLPHTLPHSPPHNSSPRPPPSLAHLDAVLSRGVSRLALAMDTAIATSQSKDNIVFSPVSIAAVMALVLLGAAGQTYNELAALLGLAAGVNLADRSELVHSELGRLLGQLRSEPGVDWGANIAVASAVFVQRNLPVKKKFINGTRDIYQSEVLSLDFINHAADAKTVINSWVFNRTNGRITNLLDDAPSPGTSIVIASALYFHGEWEHPFFLNATKWKPFFIPTSDGTQEVQVPMMVNSAEVPYYLDRDLGCRVLGMPYKGNEVTMYIVLPDSSLRDFMQNLTVETLHRLRNATALTQVIFVLPRMRLESTVELQAPLQAMGVHSLFDARHSNLSGIAEGMFVSSAVHKVELEVTETNTIGSAATAISLTRDGSMPLFKADHPFLFFIHHAKTNTIIFWGTVTKPTPFSSHDSNNLNQNSIKP